MEGLEKTIKFIRPHRPSICTYRVEVAATQPDTCATKIPEAYRHLLVAYRSPYFDRKWRGLLKKYGVTKRYVTLLGTSRLIHPRSPIPKFIDLSKWVSGMFDWHGTEEGANTWAAIDHEWKTIIGLYSPSLLKFYRVQFRIPIPAIAKVFGCSRDMYKRYEALNLPVPNSLRPKLLQFFPDWVPSSHGRRAMNVVAAIIESSNGGKLEIKKR